MYTFVILLLTFTAIHVITSILLICYIDSLFHKPLDYLEQNYKKIYYILLFLSIPNCILFKDVRNTFKNLQQYVKDKENGEQ